MFRALLFFTLLVGALLTPGCAALQQLAALRQVDFEFDRVADVRIAGVSVSGRRGYGDLGVVDVGRLTAAVVSHNVPLEAVVHVRGTNPPTNQVTARMLELGWTFFVEDREVVGGQLAETYLFEPGVSTDVPIRVRFNAYDEFGGGGKSLFELALAIAGVSGSSKEVRADLVPTVSTSVGPIRYPTPITVRRTIGG
jgi:hypothetical protein